MQENQENNIIQTPYGVFAGVISSECYPEGGVKELRLGEKNVILTHAGDLIPYYGDETPRRKFKSSVSFHKSGMVKSVCLEEQQDVLTPIGEFPAELVTFYDTGELKRIFPLDGKISGFWTEEDERELNIPFNFEFEFASFSAMLIGICFFKNGEIKSITLYPGEEISIDTPGTGKMKLRCGFSLFESGKLESAEPAAPTKLKTPIGEIMVFDTQAIGVNADDNSLRFDEEGRITALATSISGFTVSSCCGETRFFKPDEVINPLDGESMMIVPLRLEFDYENEVVVIQEASGEKSPFSFKESFIIFKAEVSGCSGLDCSSCSSCSH